MTIDHQNLQRADFDRELADAMIGKTLLVGLTYKNQNDETTGIKQFHGEVISASSEKGIVLRLSGSGEEFALPPDLSHIESAPPGDYRLRVSGEVVVNPNFLCTYVIYSDSR